MKTIEEYILESQKMENTSDGGSPAYHFDDVVLVEYYGRENEEAIAIEANKKNKKGVRTPAHLAIKREVRDGRIICWVLQERAKGVSFNNYYSLENEPERQLELQQQLLDAPDLHYEKLISDICELYNMGIELKPKNIYYDTSKEDGGFTIIDLLSANGTPLNMNSLKDILTLKNDSSFISGFSQIYSYDDKATEDQKEKSRILSNKICQKTFNAINKFIPSKYRRYVLRTYPRDIIEFFSLNGIDIGDLTLNEEERREFSENVEIIVLNILRMLEEGKIEFWQVEANEIRFALDDLGMYDSWKFHTLNPLRREDFEDDYDYDYECRHSLEEQINMIFNERLDSLSQVSFNPNLLAAKKELDESREINSGKKY